MGDQSLQIIRQLELEVWLQILEIEVIVCGTLIQLFESGFDLLPNQLHGLLNLGLFGVLLVQKRVPLDHECHLLLWLSKDCSQFLTYQVC